jgi:DNA-binding transcriptional LysR family regulator
MTTPATPEVFTAHGTTYEVVYPADRPAVPGLTADGLACVRNNLLARAAAAEAQGRAAAGTPVALFCAGEASALRSAATQLTAYALTPSWAVRPDLRALPTTRPVPQVTR